MVDLDKCDVTMIQDAGQQGSIIPYVTLPGPNPAMSIPGLF